MGKRPPWDSYLAVSKVPWLHALAAWHHGSTWPSPARPAPVRTRPARGSTSVPGLRRLRDVQRDDSLFRIVPRPAPSPLVLRRSPPADDRTALLLALAGHDHSLHGIEGAENQYVVERDGDLTELPDAAWADWDAHGRLLIDTVGGALRIASVTPVELEPVWTHDLSPLRPDPTPAPAWAMRW
jgi:hypothetical protein